MSTRARALRPLDFLWLLLFAALAYLRTNLHPAEIPILAGLAVLQILGPRLAVFATRGGAIVLVLSQFLLTYLLVGYTGGLTSSYYLLLLLPLVSAATSFGPLGSAVFTVVACGSYLSFLLLLDWGRFVLGAEEQRELALRVTVFAAIGYLSNTLSAASREQSRKYKSVAEQLATANRSLQEAEAAVRRTERLAALGQLSAGLAHELRNPLGTIKASAEVLTRSILPENDVAGEVAGFISSEVDRTNLIVTRFLDFARPLQLRLAEGEITAVIDRAIQNLEHNSPRYDVLVLRNYSPEIAPFLFDAELVERVFFNLLLNAAQATPPGGEITVKTRRAGGFVEISVIDRGAGVEPQDLENIFNPFFTTKKGGVGLGLAIVSKIVDEHGGRMAVESELGKGSVFRVYLPARKTAPEAPAGE